MVRIMCDQTLPATIFALLVAAPVELVTGEIGSIGVVVVVAATVANTAAAKVLAPAPTRAGGRTATAGLGVFASIIAAAPTCSSCREMRKSRCNATAGVRMMQTIRI